MREKADIRNLTPKADAIDMIFQKWAPEERVKLTSVLEVDKRVLAEDMYSKVNLPVVRASKMDGVAVKSQAFVSGMPDTENWVLGEDYVRADTGDDFDDAFDAVLRIEDVTVLENGGLKIAEGVEVVPGLNVRPCGSFLKKGELLAKKGTILTPQAVGVLAMGGHSMIPVRKKPRVTFIPTGSELVAIGEELGRGQYYECNSLMIYYMLKQMGAKPEFYPIVKDDKEQIREALHEVLPESDIVIIGAGTSKGGEDYSSFVLEEEGEMLFHGVAAVPGRPMSAAMIDGKPVVNISGPSFAAFYSVDWMIRALVSRALDIPVPVREKVKATLTAPLMMPPFFSLISAIRLEKTDDGYAATPVALRGPNPGGGVDVFTAQAVYISELGEKPKQTGEEIEVELLCNRAMI